MQLPHHTSPLLQSDHAEVHGSPEEDTGLVPLRLGGSQPVKDGKIFPPLLDALFLATSVRDVL